MIKPIILINECGKEDDALIDTQRMLIFKGYMTTEFAEKLGYTWKECEEDRNEDQNNSNRD